MEKLFNPDYLHQLCRTYKLTPSKKYGQNYLVDPDVIERILETATLDKNDTVVEIGPGFGVLTLPLAARVARVVAFEIEKKLEPYWKTRQVTNVDIVWGNVLKEFSAYKLPSAHYKLVANLPYQITSFVIRMFLEAENRPKTMTLMVQKEVAERICAKPGDMSVLSVAVQYYAEPTLAFMVSRSSFWPSPAVDSAVIHVALTDAPRDAAFEKLFFTILRIGFAQRRKLLIKNLEPFVGKKNRSALLDIVASLGLLPTCRAQELSVEQWKSLARSLGQIRKSNS